MTSRTRGGLGFTLALVVLLALSAHANTPRPCRPDGRYVMGTVLELNLCGPVASEAFEQAFATATELDRLFTTWADDSAVLTLNRAAGAAVPNVPPAVREILSEAIEYTRATHGAFDVSVGPLVDVWRTAGRNGALPSADLVANARSRIGASRIELRESGTVLLPVGMTIDLGGLAKGFALDQIAADLRARGVKSGLLDFGQSSLVAMGSPPDADAWNVLLRRPDGPVVGRVSLRDMAASTSATFGRSTEIAGRRYSHVIDPRTGRPVDGERLAFVIAPRASVAEALSTSLIVLGEGGLALVEARAGAEALYLDGSTGQLRTTAGFGRATDFRPADPAS